MNAMELFNKLSQDGARFEMEGESFRIRAPRGVVSEGMRKEITAAKPEILALLKQTEIGVTISYIAGNCPHCRKPLLVYTHPFDDEVWIQCPTRSELFKTLKYEACEWCRDCGERLTVTAGRCVECIQRVIIAPGVPCPSCGSLRFWRHRASQKKPPGFAWYCANCKEPSGKVAIYKVN